MHCHNVSVGVRQQNCLVISLFSNIQLIKYSSTTAIPKRDPVTAAKFVQIHFTLKRYLDCLRSAIASLSLITILFRLFYTLGYSVLP